VHARGSVTAAARRLNLTQPAVTLQLRNLEALAGLPLVQRNGKSMHLTDAGREVMVLTERIEAALVDCEQTLDMIAGRSGGRVSIGAAAKYFVPFASAAFSKRHPKIDIILKVGNREDIRQARAATISISRSRGQLLRMSRWKSVCLASTRMSSFRRQPLACQGRRSCRG
jgi:DNA-binding transcriptional LysR family regulator